MAARRRLVTATRPYGLEARWSFGAEETGFRRGVMAGGTIPSMISGLPFPRTTRRRQGGVTVRSGREARWWCGEGSQFLEISLLMVVNIIPIRIVGPL